MNLKKCKDCGNDVSRNAKTCPHCGAKTKEISFIKSFLIACLILIFAGYLFYNYQKWQLQQATQQHSAEFERDMKEAGLWITKGKYEQIENGMNYSAVVQIIGWDGDQISSSRVGNYFTETYMWRNFNEDSHLIVIFQNGIVSVVTQSGLTDETASTEKYSP